MNEQTIQLLEKLAAKLGTTSEYLWSILIKQAPVDATINLIQLIIVGVFGYVIFRIHKKLLSNIKSETNYTYYDEYEASVGIPMMIVFVAWLILAVACLCSIGYIINGYFNPEYWALDNILNSLKSK